MKKANQGKRRTSRRRFLKGLGAASVPFFVPASVLGRARRAAANDRITMAAIGVGGQGRGDMGAFLGRPEVQVLAVCDPVPAHRDMAKNMVDKRYGNRACALYNDFRDVLARTDIDTVLIATPDHWHAVIGIEACKSGKDVYCEKPESLTVREGRKMVEAARRYGRVFSGGSQRVMDDYGGSAHALRTGLIGEVKEIYINCGGPSGDCYLKPEPIPAGLDWDMWLGPAPWRPYAQTLIQGGFRPYRDYSGGGMTDWGAHNFGGAMFGANLQHTGPVEIIPPDGRDHRHLTYRFANGLLMYHSPNVGAGITYNGTEGSLSGHYRGPQRSPDMPGYKGSGGIFGDFLHCVRTRERPFRDIEWGHRVCTVCHLGNIAYWLNRRLRWDPVKEQIIGDEEANRWLERPKRGLWTLS